MPPFRAAATTNTGLAPRCGGGVGRGQGSQLQKPRATEGPWTEIFVEGCHQHVDPYQQESGPLAGLVRPILSRSHCL